jgi:hypothetical protein
VASVNDGIGTEAKTPLVIANVYAGDLAETVGFELGGDFLLSVTYRKEKGREISKMREFKVGGTKLARNGHFLPSESMARAHSKRYPYALCIILSVLPELRCVTS